MISLCCRARVSLPAAILGGGLNGVNYEPVDFQCVFEIFSVFLEALVNA